MRTRIIFPDIIELKNHGTRLSESHCVLCVFPLKCGFQIKTNHMVWNMTAKGDPRSVFLPAEADCHLSELKTPCPHLACLDTNDVPESSSRVLRSPYTYTATDSVPLDVK